MAGRGATPRGEVIRIPRGAKAKETPELTGNHCRETIAWWKTWCESPQAAVFTATEWQTLAMLAPLVDAYFAKPSAAVKAEIRIGESKLGATREDRLRLRWVLEGEGEIEEVDLPGSNPVSSRRRPDPRLEAFRDPTK